ncbi:MAG: acylphosphatase [Flavobacteriales bacterium]
MKKHLQIIVRGKVQGVYFRRDTQLQAQKLGVNGTVANQEDGSVIIKAEADEKVIDTFLAWCNHGPELANVTEVVTTNGEMQGYTSFEVLAEASDFLS